MSLFTSRSTERYKPRLLKTGLAKKSAHSATCQFKTMKNLSKAD